MAQYCGMIPHFLNSTPYFRPPLPRCRHVHNAQRFSNAEIKEFNIAVVVEAWMSYNIDLLYKSVGKEKDEKAENYDPLKNLKALHESYPECCVYLSMLSFKQDWQEILPRLST